VLKQSIVMVLALGILGPMAWAQSADQGLIPWGSRGGSQALLEEYNSLSRNLDLYLETLSPAEQADLKGGQTPLVNQLSYREFQALRQRMEEVKALAADPWVYLEYLSKQNGLWDLPIEKFMVNWPMIIARLGSNYFAQYLSNNDPFQGTNNLEILLLEDKNLFVLTKDLLPQIPDYDQMREFLLTMEPQMIFAYGATAETVVAGLVFANLFQMEGQEEKAQRFADLSFQTLTELSQDPDKLPVLLHAVELSGMATDAAMADKLWTQVEELLSGNYSDREAYLGNAVTALVALGQGRGSAAQNYYDRAMEFYEKDPGIDTNSEALLLRLFGAFDQQAMIQEYYDAFQYRFLGSSGRWDKYALWTLAAVMLDIGEYSKAMDTVAKLMKEFDIKEMEEPYFVSFLMSLAGAREKGYSNPPIFFPIMDHFFDTASLIDPDKDLEIGTFSNLSWITIWTQEGEADGAFQYVQGLAEDFVRLKRSELPNLQIVVENRETETLREDFAVASLMNQAPELVWTVSDHAGPFHKADIILPLDELVDLSVYRPEFLKAVRLEGKTYGVPVNGGNHLMLYYNKELLPEPPRTTDELISVGKELTKGDRYALVFTQTEPFWLVPWLGGFGGEVFAEDRVSGTLNTPEMVATLQFLSDLKFVHGILPKESDYNGADTLFKEGKAAMIINGDWILGEYLNLMGDQLGVARLPRVSETGLWPAPYFSGKYMMLSKALINSPEKTELLLEFMAFATNKKNQQDLVYYLTRLPALQEAYEGI
jgi:arabinogalactan oligomer/maltooligosaccharide transport system substrate-binding protein